MKKHWWQSKTLVINLLAVVAIVAQYLLDIQVIDLKLQTMILAVINVVLRVLTNKALTK